MDPIFSRGLKLLLSSDADAPEQLRNMLDEALRQKYGPSKMISVVMPHKKLKVEEGYSVGILPLTMRAKKERNSVDSTGSPTVQSGAGEPDESNPSSDDNGDDNDLSINITMLGEDLSCVVCGQMDVSARNQLVECAECHSLYHQDCHQPPVLEVGEPLWYCVTCSKKVAVKNSPVAKQEKSNTSSGTSTIVQAVSTSTPFSSIISSGTSNTSSGSSKSYSGSSKSSSKTSSSSNHKSSSGSSTSKHSSSKKSSSSSSSSSSHKHHHKSSSSSSSKTSR